MKRRFLTVLAMLMAMTGLFAFFVGCKEEEPTPTPPPVEEPGQSGAEVGEYYYDADGVEYLITLSEKTQFTLSISGEVTTGVYTLEGESLTFKVSESESYSATYKDEAITLSYRNVTYRFIRKVNYSVKFETNGGGSLSDVTVLNGKSIQRPENPEKEGMVFVAWYLDSAFKSLYLFGTPVTENMTLYARFVAPIEPEFSVKFDLGYDGEPIPDRKTVGGIVVDLPQPEREGYTFAGWWVSHYDDREKLTYQYREQVLKENMTLFAVWESDAPLLSVESEKITWSASGVNNNYTLKITAPDGSEDSRSLSTTSLAYDFASKPAGEYIVEITLNGKTTSAYFKNKALARVSVFQVEDEESVLLFNGVENAQKYYITVECGSPEHDHAREDLGTETAFRFGDCEMRPGGITFVVTATADGYLSSESEMFVYEKVLGEVTGLMVDGSTETVNWKAVEKATSYEVTVTLNDKEVFHGNIGGELSYPLKDLGPGQIVITVTPIARGWNSPAASRIIYQKTRLASPKNLHIEESTIVWEEVPGATGYELKVGNALFIVGNQTSFVFTEEHANGLTQFAISVRALGASMAQNSLFTDELNVRYGDMGEELSYKQGVVTWEPIFGVRRYAVHVNGGEPVYVENANSCAVILTRAGENVITVSAIIDEDGKESTPASVKVNAFEIIFDAQFGTDVEPMYKAAGDPIELPKTLRAGFEFVGWYTAPDGAGQRYSDPYFEENANFKLYAFWSANLYTVTLNVGLYGEELEEADRSRQVPYRSNYELPVPTTSDVTKAFIGWFTEENSGLQYTDHLGKSKDVYVELRDITLYAHWVNLYTFTKLENGYSVSKGPGIAYVTEITIPVNCPDGPITTVESFADCDNLEIIRIPDTIQVIALETSASAFLGCDKLQKVIIYEVEGNHERIYSDVDGVLLFQNSVTGNRELRYFPADYQATSYRVPDGVTLIPAGAFLRANRLTLIEVASSVVVVESKAFQNCGELKRLVFLDGEDAASLSLNAQAIDSCVKLEEVVLPSRLTEFASNAIDEGCSQLINIKVDGTGGLYSDKDGVLVKTVDGGAELVLFPRGRGGEYTIPAGVVSVGASAFSRNGKITKITIPTYVREIGSKAFYFCQGMTDLIFEGTERDLSLTIREQAFYGCSKLTEITLPANLVKLETSAFGATSKLTVVHVESGTKDGTVEFANYAFGSTGSNSKTYYVTTVYLGKNVPEFDISSVFGDKLERIIVDPENGNYTSDEDGVVYNKSMTLIAFYPTAKEGPYVVPNTVTIISSNIFKGRAGLTEIKIPKSVVEIGMDAFNGCVNLKKIEFEDGGTTLSIGSNAFYNCQSLTEIRFPDYTTKIDQQAFHSCIHLKSVYFPASLNEIFLEMSVATSGLFYNCNELEAIEVAAENTTFASVDGILYGRTYDEHSRQYLITDLLICPYGKKGTVELPSSVRVIHSYAFAGNALTSDPMAPSITEITFKPLDQMYDEEQGKLVPGTLEVQHHAFYYNYNIQKVTFPEGTTYIGENAFYWNRALTQVNIPSTVTKIDKKAFYNCTALATITFDETTSAEKVPLEIADGESGTNGVFSGCSSLRSVRLPERLVVLGGYAFYNSGIQKVDLPASLETIGAYAFSGCDLKEVGFAQNSNLKEIGDYAFNENKNLNSFEWSTKLERIGNSAFYMTGLSEVKLYEGLQEVGEKAFAYSQLTFLDIPASVAAIGARAFYEIPELQTVTFRDNSQLKVLSTYSFAYDYNITSFRFGANASLMEMEDYVFPDVRRMEKITLPASLEKIGKGTFIRMSSLAEIEFEAGSKLAAIGDYAFQQTGLKTFSFPESSVDQIVLGQQLFMGCTTLTEVTLSSKITAIENVFKGCGSIKKIHVASGNAHFTPDEQYPILYNKDKTAVRLVYSDYQGVLTIPSGATQISSSAFYGQVNLQKVIIPASIQEIGASAFENCINLESVSFYGQEGEFSVLKTIGASAFANCWKLSEFDFTQLPDLVTVGDMAFQYTALTSANFEKQKGTLKLGAQAFEYASKLTSAKLPSGVTLGKSVFGDTGIKSFLFPAEFTLEKVTSASYSIFSDAPLERADLSKVTMTKLPDYLFAGNSKLSQVVLPQTITSFGKYVFSGCTSLKSITLPKRLETLDTYVFQNCTSLQSLDFTSTALTTLGNSDFAKCTALTSVRFPSTLNSIGTYLFQNCEKLQTVDLSMTSLTKLGNYMFDACYALTDVNLPKTITSWPTYMFWNCTSLESFDLSEFTMTALPSNIFTGCTSLATVQLPKGLTQTGSYVFQGSGLTEIELPETVTSIGMSAFAGTKLKSVKLPSKLATLNGKAFLNCKLLADVDFNGNTTLKTLGNNAFEGCSALTSISLPSSLTFLGKNTFQDSGLKKIDLSNLTGLKVLGSSATACNANSSSSNDVGLFMGCADLAQVILPSTVTKIGPKTFSGCVSLKSIDLSNMVLIGEAAFQNSGLVSVEVPELVYNATATKNSFGAYLFADCRNLTSVTLSENQTYLNKGMFSGCTSLREFDLKNVAEIGDEVFRGCEKLQKFTMSGSAFTTNDEGILCTADGTLLFFPMTILNDEEEYTLTGCTKIGLYAFENMSRIKRLIIPETVTAIGDYAFAGSQFEEITIMNAEALKSAKNLFDGASKLKKINLPDGIETIGDYWFRNCESLTEFDLPETVQTIGTYAFFGTKLNQVEIPASVTKIGHYAFSKTPLKEATIRAQLDTTTAAGDYVFANCTELQSVTIAEGFECVGKHWFDADTALKTVKLPSSLSIIADYAFRSSGIEQIELNEGLSEIKTTAFSKTLLTSIVIPDTVTSMGASIFNGCEKLESVVLSEGLSMISASTFSGCIALREITIPSSVSQIMAGSFTNCKSLNLFIPKTLTTMKDTFSGWTEEQTIYFEGSLFEAVSVYGTSWLQNLKAKVVFEATAEDMIQKD